MLGKRLQAATQIVENAGKQIEVLLETLEEQLVEALSQQGIIAVPNEKLDDVLADDYEWVTKSYVKNMSLYRSRKHKKHYGYLALQVTIHSRKEMAQVRNWEPVLYIAFSPETLEATPFNYDLCTVASHDERICFFWSDLVEEEDKEDSWFVAAPLTRLGNEAILEENIVKPVCVLLKKDFEEVKASAAIPPTTLLFRFTSGEGQWSVAL